MIYVAAALLFALAFVAAATVLHLTVRDNWADIVRALRGELGVKRPAAPAGSPRAAFSPSHS